MGMTIRERIADADFGLDGNELGRDCSKDYALRAQLSRLLALVEAVMWERSGVTMMGNRGAMTRHPTVDEALSALKEHGDV